MHIKKFKAATMSEALEKVKQELGEDAVIMHTGHKQVRNPNGGGTIRIAEVVAAVDFDMSAKPAPRKNTSPVIKKKRNDVVYSPPAYRQHELSTERPKKNNPVPSSQEQEISELKNMLQEAINALREARQQSSVKSEEPSPLAVIMRVFRQLDIPVVMHQPLASRLLDHEYSKDITERKVFQWVKKYAEQAYFI
jgi:flagellar biosynthesis protein FlhF